MTTETFIRARDITNQIEDIKDFLELLKESSMVASSVRFDLVRNVSILGLTISNGRIRSAEVNLPDTALVSISAYLEDELKRLEQDLKEL